MRNSKNIKKRINSTRTYIDVLSKNHSKLNIVRVDLAYKKPYCNSISLEDANDDMNHLLNNRRSNPSIFKNIVGHVCKREYTEDRGVHFHMLFISDGQKVKNSSFKADQIGAYWNQITSNKGSYHNCHSNSYEQNGIGMLVHDDKEKRKILDEKVIPYLCKEEQNIKSINAGKNTRAFTRGIMPKGNSSKVGRPRKK